MSTYCHCFREIEIFFLKMRFSKKKKKDIPTCTYDIIIEIR